MTETRTEYALQNVKTGEIDTTQIRYTPDAIKLHLYSRRNQEDLKIVKRKVEVKYTEWK